jgi:hypothetical protein
MPGDSIWGFGFDPVSDIKNFLSQFDTGLKLGNLFDAASHGDQSAQAYTGYLWYQAGKNSFETISNYSSKATLAFLAVGAPEAAGISSEIGLIADIGITIDDIITGNYADAAISSGAIVAGLLLSADAQAGVDSVINKRLKITVEENGLYYSAGRRGAMKT